MKMMKEEETSDGEWTHYGIDRWKKKTFFIPKAYLKFPPSGSKDQVY